MKPLRVLAIVPSAFCFGLQNLTLALFAARRSQLDARFINTRWNDGEFPRRLDQLSYPHTATWLGMFSRKLDGRNLKMTLECLLKLPAAWWHFIRVYRSFRPDVIYMANYHEVILLWPLLIWLRKRVFCHMHDPPPAAPFYRWCFKVWRLAVGRFVFISNSACERMSHVGELGEDDLVIHNGVGVSPLDWPRQRRADFVTRFEWPADSIVVGITGQMTATKGFEDFVEAGIMASKKDARLRFVVGGKADSLLADQLKRQIAAADAADLFGFSGWLPSSRDFFENIDVFVMASRHEEGFGLVVAEAMERGVAVISTRSGGAVEIIEEGISGLVVPPRTPQALAGKMVELSQSKEHCIALGREGRRRIETHFNLETQASRFEACLRGQVWAGDASK